MASDYAAERRAAGRPVPGDLPLALHRGTLAEEQAQSARLYEQLETSVQQGGGERVQQLEALLAEEQQRSAQLTKRVEELERALVAANERVGQIAKLLQPGS